MPDPTGGMSISIFQSSDANNRGNARAESRDGTCCATNARPSVGSTSDNSGTNVCILKTIVAGILLLKIKYSQDFRDITSSSVRRKKTDCPATHRLTHRLTESDMMSENNNWQ
jgi:hypothetical protein